MKTSASPAALLEQRATRTVSRLQERGFESYWAGGCVRDRLLGKAPYDYDIATAAHPEVIHELFPGSVLVGKAFGVVRVPVETAVFEVATFRSESNYQDGRHPESVCFTDAETDAGRRDFTMNAIFYDPIGKAYVDYVNGRADIEARCLRCVGPPMQRFEEDHLRLLRALRFSETLGFTIEPHTEAALRACAPLITRISAERIRDELTRILLEAPRPGQALTHMNALGLMEPILPEVAALQHQPQPPEFHPEGDVFTHTMMMLDAMQHPTKELAYAVLLHDIAKPLTATLDGDRIRFNGHDVLGADVARAILRRLRFSNETVEAVTHCVRRHMCFRDVPAMRESTKRKLLGQPTFETELALHRLDCLASHGKLDNYRELIAFREQLGKQPVMPPPLVGGRDVIALGVPQGPRVGAWLQRAYDRQLEEPATASRESQLRWLTKQIAAEAADGDNA